LRRASFSRPLANEASPDGPHGLAAGTMPDGLDTGAEYWDDGAGRRYRMEKVVGNGAFGIVWRAREEGTSESVAIKKVVLDRRYHNRELEMMKGLDHMYVIRLHHSFEKPCAPPARIFCRAAAASPCALPRERRRARRVPSHARPRAAPRSGRKRDETYLHLVMDFLPETIRSVALQFQKDRVRFPIDHVRVYLYQTLKALEYVHGKRICHRDLKPDNLLVDPATLRLKLIDFGCAKVLVKGQPNVSYICSRYYRAPELMFGATEYSVAVDVWSVGTILMELLLGHLPFQGQDSTQQHLVEIMKLLGTPTDRDLQAMRATCQADDLPKLKAYPWERVFPANTPSEAVDLAQRLLRYDPDERLTATMVRLASPHPHPHLPLPTPTRTSPRRDLARASSRPR
jgi:serine/threonine protein kinase